ncbi:MAG TPA: response regulator [Anaerolineae bacterium]|nr:response regulator [Anaerolineae bacterium]
MLNQASASGIGPARILIVDDHPNTASTLARILGQTETPVEILTAQTGREALALIGDNAIDILIADYRMPGMNGLELIAKLKTSQARLYTILITAYDTARLTTLAQTLKVDDYLIKPIQPEIIRAIVNRVLAERQPSLPTRGRGAGGNAETADELTSIPPHAQ